VSIVVKFFFLNVAPHSGSFTVAIAQDRMTKLFNALTIR